MTSLRISSLNDEGVYQGSKWQKIQVLCETEELQELFKTLAPFWIFPLTGIRDGKPLSLDFFTQEYGRWIEGLQKGKLPSEEDLKKILACVFIDDLNALWLQPVPNGYLTKISKPVVQVQAHFFTYSSIDQVFRPMSMGQESIFWGLQFSFPQIYQDAKTMELREIEDNSLFRKIQLWARGTTRATPFFVEGRKANASIRIGKKCFPWIHCHPQLVQQKIGVVYAS